jgi:hypothetical protein
LWLLAIFHREFPLFRSRRLQRLADYRVIDLIEFSGWGIRVRSIFQLLAVTALALLSADGLTKSSGLLAQPLPASRAPQAPQFVFHITLNAEPARVSSLKDLLQPFFDRPIDLTPLLKTIIAESAVADLADAGKLLYNPAHSLFFHLNNSPYPQARVATLGEVRDSLADTTNVPTHEGADPVFSAYTEGFQYLAQLSTLMSGPDTKKLLDTIWAASPRSQQHKELIQYLLLRPLQQSAAIRNVTPECRRVIEHFVNEVRDGRRSTIPTLPGLTKIVRPSRFIKQGDYIFLVLSDPLIARFYVLTQIRTTKTSCRVTSEVPLFVM